MDKIQYNTYKNFNFNKNSEIIISKMIKSLFFIGVFIIAFLSPLSKEERFNKILPNYSYIELIINGTGNTSIFYIDENNEICQGVIPIMKFK